MDPQHFVNDLLDEAKKRPFLTAEQAFDRAFEQVLEQHKSALRRLRDLHRAKLVRGIEDGRLNGWPVSVSV